MSKRQDMRMGLAEDGSHRVCRPRKQKADAPLGANLLPLDLPSGETGYERRIGQCGAKRFAGAVRQRFPCHVAGTSLAR